MSPISIGVIAVSMSVDAFIASLGRGAQHRRPGFGLALRTGLLFGVIEALTPLIGWAMGVVASQYVQQVDHWIAFGLLAAVGGRMLMQALRAQEESAPPPGGWALIATAVGTSIDAMAVGVSLACLEVNIVIIALAIGLATTVMSAAGILAGRLVGLRFGRWAEGLGGVALAGLGLMILVDHLTAG